MAAKMDQHMQQLAAEGVHHGHLIINRMMGYTPELHKIWVSTTDAELISLSNEFPGFYRYALIMEEASEAERNMSSRSYDDMQALSKEHQRVGAALMTTAATLERGYQAFLGSGKLTALQPQIIEMDRIHQQWLLDLADFKESLKAEIDPKAMTYIEEAFGRMAERIKELARLSNNY